jgi:hypothetical protein
MDLESSATVLRARVRAFARGFISCVWHAPDSPQCL